ncbi:MAG: tyrosine-type recombinase/integrase [Bacteroidetes bacterium]|nr:tyrosine-type recombinase/integrase [Bacteroidota bacterium]
MPLKRFLSHLQYEKRYSAHTLTAYESDLTQFLDYLQTEYQTTQISEVSHFYIRPWIVSLMEDKIAARSVNRKITALKSFFIMELFYGSGMRLSELVNLKISDINFSNQAVKVLGKRNKERIIPLSGTVMTQLKEYITARSAFITDNGVESLNLFLDNRCNKVYPKFVYRLVRKYLGQVTTGDKKNPHILRHTFATHMLNNGAEINAVKELLGHASLAATQVYTHNTIEKLKNIYKQAHPKA